jgi:hypothetical protein
VGTHSQLAFLAQSSVLCPQSSCWSDGDFAVLAAALAFGYDAGIVCKRKMNDPSFVGAHRAKAERRSRRSNFLGCLLRHQPQFLFTLRAVTARVERDSYLFARVTCESAITQVLERVKQLSVVTQQQGYIAAAHLDLEPVAGLISVGFQIKSASAQHAVGEFNDGIKIVLWHRFVPSTGWFQTSARLSWPRLRDFFPAELAPGLLAPRGPPFELPFAPASAASLVGSAVRRLMNN